MGHNGCERKGKENKISETITFFTDLNMFTAYALQAEGFTLNWPQNAKFGFNSTAEFNGSKHERFCKNCEFGTKVRRFDTFWQVVICGRYSEIFRQVVQPMKRSKIFQLQVRNFQSLAPIMFYSVRKMKLVIITQNASKLISTCITCHNLSIFLGVYLGPKF